MYESTTATAAKNDLEVVFILFTISRMAERPYLWYRARQERNCTVSCNLSVVLPNANHAVRVGSEARERANRGGCGGGARADAVCMCHPAEARVLDTRGHRASRCRGHRSLAGGRVERHDC